MQQHICYASTAAPDWNGPFPLNNRSLDRDTDRREHRTPSSRNRANFDANPKKYFHILIKVQSGWGRTCRRWGLFFQQIWCVDRQSAERTNVTPASNIVRCLFGQKWVMNDMTGGRGEAGAKDFLIFLPHSHVLTGETDFSRPENLWTHLEQITTFSFQYSGRRHLIESNLKVSNLFNQNILASWDASTSMLMRLPADLCDKSIHLIPFGWCSEEGASVEPPPAEAETCYRHRGWLLVSAIFTRHHSECEANPTLTFTAASAASELLR